MLPRGIPEGNCDWGEGVVIGIGIKKKIPWKRLRKRGLLGGEGVKKGLVWRPLALHTKFEVSSFCRFRDTKVITHRITDITIGLHIASFAYIGGRKHKNIQKWLQF